MSPLRIVALVAAAAAGLGASELSKTLTISFESDGRTKNEIPTLKPGDKLHFNLPSGTIVRYQLSPDISDGKLVSCTDPQLDSDDNTLSILPVLKVARAGVEGGVDIKPVRAIYFNLLGPIPPDPGDAAKLKELEEQLNYYRDLNRPLSWGEKKMLQDQIANNNDRVSQLQEEIKAYSGISLNLAVSAIDERQRAIRDLRTQIREFQKRIDHGGLQDKVDDLTKQVAEQRAKVESSSTNRQLLRAGVLVVGENRKPVYYMLNHTADASAPWLLKRFQDFPVFTVDDVPYVVVLGQRFNQDPKALRATFGTKAGAYIDSDPVRPLLTQGSVVSKGQKIDALVESKRVEKHACAADEVPTFAYVDRVLQFTDHFVGETAYSLTVTGYGVATQTDTVTVATGTTPANQHQTVQAMMTLKPLDGDTWPQVHSLYRYNLTAGVIWTGIRTPSFSRVGTGNYLPTGCSPTTSSTATGSTTSNTTSNTPTGSTTTVGTTTTAPSSSTTTTCLPTYQTVTVAGGPRILPVVMFSRYWHQRDTQNKKGSWAWVFPVPTVGLSLTSPADDFFLGGSSEFPFLRNVQLVYGAHLGRVQKLGANSFQNPTDSSAPQTTTSLHVGEFVGLTFNLDFVKGIFKQ